MPKWLVNADLTKPLTPPKQTKWRNNYSGAARRLPEWLLRAKPSANIKRPPWLQKGRGLSDVAKTVASNPYLQEVGKKIISKGINSMPYFFRKGTKKIRNKKLKRVLESDLAIDLVNHGTQKLRGTEKLH